MTDIVALRAASAQRSDFDELGSLPVRRIMVTPARTDELDALLELAVAEIPALRAAGPAVHRVQSHHPQSIWAFHRGGRIVGCYAMLHLNIQGLAQLLAGIFDGGNPDVALLARPGETVAAIYKWAVVAPGLAAEGIRAISHQLATPLFARADLFARATTPAAARLMSHLGFTPMSARHPERLRYVRKVNRMTLAHVA
ncbi:MAG: hypothetical protein AB7O56_04055 [Bauldia sp.]